MAVDKVILPEGYVNEFTILETEIAIKKIKDLFQKTLAEKLKLTRVSAPLFVKTDSGLNDGLNGVERPVAFDMKDSGDNLEIVQSLAKWKRLALKRYGVEAGKGIYADMNAIRRDEDLDNTHSIYVDQWDWEKVLTKETRNVETLKETVRKIFSVFKKTQNMLAEKYEKAEKFLPEEVTFVTSQELEDLYPELTPEERENVYAKEKGAIFITQIGKTLRSGKKHDNRAPDYDDWELNGDLILWNPVLDSALELSSMGIRVDEKSLAHQLQVANAEHRKSLDYHQMLLRGELPLTIGGGIGQSRICMLLMQKAHIGEVQASIWTDDMLQLCEENGIQLL